MDTKDRKFKVTYVIYNFWKLPYYSPKDKLLELEAIIKGIAGHEVIREDSGFEFKKTIPKEYTQAELSEIVEKINRCLYSGRIIAGRLVTSSARLVLNSKNMHIGIYDEDKPMMDICTLEYI